MGLKLPFLLKIIDSLKNAYGQEAVSMTFQFLPKWITPILLSRFGATIGEDIKICNGLKLENTYNGYNNLSIGNNCYIGYETLFDLTGRITIEDSVVLAPRCTILTHQDVGDRPLSNFIRPTKEHTILRKGCWIGAGAIILGGVEIGENAVVGAGSVVNKNVDAFCIYAGVPARLIKMLDKTIIEGNRKF